MNMLLIKLYEADSPVETCILGKSCERRPLRDSIRLPRREDRHGGEGHNGEADRGVHEVGADDLEYPISMALGGAVYALNSVSWRQVLKKSEIALPPHFLRYRPPHRSQNLIEEVRIRGAVEHEER